jgi:PAS domain S-box-containing protein
MGSINIAIVDDDKTVSVLLSRFLSREAPHLSIASFESGPDLLEYLKANEVDCILSDYQMPVMSGLEMLAAINEQGYDIPVIFITGQGNEDLARDVFKSGAFDYFTKDIGFAHFPRIINSIEQAVKRRAADRSRLEAEAALTQERDKLESILSNVAEGITIQDTNYRVLYQNKAHIGLRGIHTGEYCYKAYEFRDELCPGCPLTETFKDGLVHSVQRSIEMAGKAMYFDIASSPLRDASGRIVSCIEVARDITESKKSEEQLRYSENFLNTLVDENPYSIWISDGEGNLVRINKACCDLIRITEDEVIGKYNILKDNVVEEQGFMPLVRKVFEKGETARFDIHYDSSRLESISLGDRTSVMLDVTIFPIMDSSGKVTNAVIQYIDITERKRVEEALEKRLLALTLPLDADAGIAFEELFNMEDIQRLQDEFARATGVASLITRPDGTPITAPSNFCHLCSEIIRKTEKGCANCKRSDTAIGRLSTQGPVVEPCMSGGLWDAGAGISVGGRHIANWLAGQVRDTTQTDENMRAYAREIGADEDAAAEAFLEVPAMSRERLGHVAQALFTLANQLSAIAYQNVQQARFITESRRVEEALRLHDKRKAELYSTISHDFKSPISTISGYANLILADKDKLDADTVEMVSIIEKSCAKLYAMVDEAVASFKEEDSILLTKKPLNIAGYLNEIIVPFNVLARQKGLTLESGISPDLPELEIDMKYLDRAVSNLLQNAINYTPAGGVITVTAGRGMSEAAPVVIISVKDTGPGISNEEQGRIFEKYYRSPKTSGIAGTGLGLFIAKTVVEAHGGRVEVQSEGGKGSTFWIILPAHNQQA